MTLSGGPTPYCLLPPPLQATLTGTSVEVRMAWL